MNLSKRACIVNILLLLLLLSLSRPRGYPCAAVLKFGTLSAVYCGSCRFFRCQEREPRSTGRAGLHRAARLERPHMLN